MENIFNIVRGSFVPVYMLSFPLVSWLICDVLALFFLSDCQSKDSGFALWPPERKVWGCNRDFAEEEEGVRVPYCPERERKNPLVSFSFFSCLFWRERETWTLRTWLFQ